MKLSNRKIKSYTPYYIGIGAFFLLAGLTLNKPFMWLISLVFLVIGVSKLVDKKIKK